MKFNNPKCSAMRLIAIFLLALVSIQLSSCHYFESEQAKLQKAQKFYKENKFNQAIVRSKGILQSDPKSCEARILLGKSQFAKFSLIDAQDSLEKARKQKCQDPQLLYFLVKMQLYRHRLSQAKQLLTAPDFAYATKTSEAQLLKGDMYFLANDYAKAKSAYAKYNEMSHNAEVMCLSNIKLSALEKSYGEVIDQSLACEKKYAGQKAYDIDQSRYLRAIAQVNQKDTQAAIKTLQSIQDSYADIKDPNIKIQSSMLLMKLYLARKDIDGAAKIAGDVLHYVAIPEVYYAKGLKYEKDNRYDLAEKQFMEALKLNPNHRPSLLALANIKFKEGNIEQAKYYTGKVDALSGKNIFTERLDELLAVKYLQAGDLDSIINKIPHDASDSSLKSQYILALAYAKKGDKLNALKVFQVIKQHLSDNTKKDLLEARLDVALREYEKAETIFQKYTEQENSYAIKGLTLLYIQEHKYKQAEDLLNNIRNKNPKNSETNLLLAEVYSITNQKQKLFDLLSQAIKLDPENGKYQLALAKMYYKYDKFTNAIEQCDNIIAKSPDAMQAYIIKANSYVRLGKLDVAAKTYKGMLAQDPRSDYAYLMLGYLSEKQSKHKQALDYIDKSLEINPRNMKAIYAKIDILAGQKEKKDTLDFARSSASLLKQKNAKQLLLGFAYSKLGDPKNAYLNYKDIIENGVHDVRFALQLYKLSKKVNGDAVAQKEFDAFIRANPESKNIFLAANYFMKAQDYGQAMKYYESFIKQNQNNPAAYNNLAWLKLQAGDTTAALKYANKAMQLAPKSPAIMDTVGQVLLKKGAYKQAGTYLLSAYKKLGDNPNVKYHLAQYYYYENDLDKSRALLHEIVNNDFSEQVEAQKLLKKISR